MANQKKTVDKIAKAKSLAKDTKTTSLSVPTGKSVYVNKNSKGYDALDAAKKIKKTISGTSGNGKFNTGTQTYKKSELAAAERIVKSGGKATKSAITVKGASIAVDRAKNATRANMAAMKLKKAGK